MRICDSDGPNNNPNTHDGTFPLAEGWVEGQGTPHWQLLDIARSTHTLKYTVDKIRLIRKQGASGESCIETWLMHHKFYFNDILKLDRQSELDVDQDWVDAGVDKNLTIRIQNSGDSSQQPAQFHISALSVTAT